jgi:hypothetical protein
MSPYLNTRKKTEGDDAMRQLLNVRPVGDRRESRRGASIEGRRRYARIETQMDIVYESPERMLITGFGDINLRGMRIDTPTPDPVGTPVKVRITLPGHKGKAIALSGQVSWARRGQSSLKGLGMGIRFVDLTDEQRRHLAAFMIRKGGLATFPQLERRFATWMN